jgi:hypothetical protein
MTAVTDLTMLAVNLAAFVDEAHEWKAATGCHPQPGTDCVSWCEACKLLATVPADMLGAARAVLRARGVER